MRINFLIPLVFLVCVAGMSVADPARTVPDDNAIRGVTAACRLGNVRTERGIIGISDPHAADPEVINLIASTGVKWVRAEFYWSEIEPVIGGGYNWATTDRMVQGYRERGIQVQAILTYIPPSLPDDWPRIDAAFQSFANAVVARYAPQGVHYWEVFNEPNLPGYGWLTENDNARANLPGYALLLARANQAVRRHDPRGVVILGGIASDQHRGVAVEETMDRLYDLGARPCFDIFAFHPYGYQNQFQQARARVDAVLQRHGDQGKPVWFNEYGWTEQAAMDMARNADVTNNPMLAALSQAGVADALFWFAAKDYSSRRNAPTFGLATFDLQIRPSFETFRYFIAQNR